MMYRLKENEKNLSIQEMAKLGGINFGVETLPIGVFDNGKFVPQDGWYGSVRTDTMRLLGACSGRYHAVSPIDAISWIDPLIRDGTIRPATIGSPDGGSHTVFSGEIDGVTEIDGKEIRNYLSIITGHDCGTGWQSLQSPICIICRNTMQMAIKAGKSSKNRLAFRHFQGIEKRIKAAKDVVAMSIKEFTLMSDVWNSMSKRKMTSKEVKDFYIKVLRPKAVSLDSIVQTSDEMADVMGDLLQGASEASKVEKEAQLIVGKAVIDDVGEKEPRALDHLLQAYEIAPGASPGTLFGAYQGLTYWLSHVRGRDATRDASLLLGEGARINARGMQAAMAMIQ